MRTINTHEEIELWLQENDDFENGHILCIDSNPLAITLGYDIENNYQANSEKIISSFKITPNNILTWDYLPGSFTPSEQDYIQSIEPLKVEKGIGLHFLTCACSFSLVANSITIFDPEIVKTTVKPWLSNKDIYIEIPMVEIPTALFWKEKFQERHLDISFRCYGSKAKHPEEVPYPDYSGYFIELTGRVEMTKEGICITLSETASGIPRSIKPTSDNGQKVMMAFANKEEHLEDVWKALIDILSDIPDVLISCGNCKFTGKEWKEIDKNKLYPKTSQRLVHKQGRLRIFTYF